MMRPREAEEAGVAQGRDSTGNPGELLSSAESPAPRSESRAKPEAEPSAAERRARALRDNLHRRKAQARARKAGPDGESPPGS